MDRQGGGLRKLTVQTTTENSRHYRRSTRALKSVFDVLNRFETPNMQQVSFAMYGELAAETDFIGWLERNARHLRKLKLATYSTCNVTDVNRNRMRKDIRRRYVRVIRQGTNLRRIYANMDFWDFMIAEDQTVMENLEARRVITKRFR